MYFIDTKTVAVDTEAGNVVYWLDQLVGSEEMEEIGSFEAKTHFSELLRRVENGEEFVVTMRGKPVASLTSVVARHRPRSVADVLKDFRLMRKEIGKRGPVLQEGETWKDLARNGLKW